MEATKTYSEKLQDPRWQKKRLSVFKRDKFACTFCGDKDTTLHVHHVKYTGEPWEAPYKDLRTLCKHCHKFIDPITFKPNIKVRKVIVNNIYVIYFFMTERGLLVMSANEDEAELGTDLAIYQNEAKLLAEFIISNSQ